MNSINGFFKDEGYGLYVCSLDRRYFSFVQEENYVVNVICFFDERKETSTQAQLQGFLDVHKERLSYGRDKDIHFLKIMMVDQMGPFVIKPSADPRGELYTDAEGEEEAAKEAGRRWVGDVWYLIEDGADGFRLFVPPQAVEDFYGIRKGLENFVRENGVQVLLPMPETQNEDYDRSPVKENADGSRNIKVAKKNKNVPWITVGMILINLLMFAMKNLGVYQAEDYSLTNDILSDSGQWYRFFTYMFLHETELHLMNNMLMLYAAGSLIEGMVNRVYFTLLYFISGIGGGFLSVWYHTKAGQPYYSLGASGAVYGIMGAILAIMILTGLWRVKSVFFRIIIVLMLLFATGAAGGRIDVMDHLGGFVCGMILCGLYLMMGSSTKKGKVL
ncbi:MAG: rhomboid family intramembrane serine protease [Lachnospiraceae bacterium]|nr:rhomboid family intramembrane serine protease [Lachnospiraceae bacterium]